MGQGLPDEDERPVMQDLKQVHRYGPIARPQGRAKSVLPQLNLIRPNRHSDASRRHACFSAHP
jgi:hypothetical protein